MADAPKTDEVENSNSLAHLIAQRRKKLAEEGTPLTHAQPWGLALSGGGIRSATFCYGLVSALAKNRVFRRFDLMSTVSGGGYIGSMIGRLATSITSSVTLQDSLGANSATSAHKSWLRANSRYLAPRGSRDQLYGLVVFLRNLAGVHLELGILCAVVACCLGIFDLLVWWGVNDWIANAAQDSVWRDVDFWKVMANIPTLWVLLPFPLIWAVGAIAWYWYMPVFCQDTKAVDRSSHKATLQLSAAVKRSVQILLLGVVDVVAWRLAQNPEHLFPLGALFAGVLTVLRFLLPMFQQISGSSGEFLRQRLPSILDMAGRFGLLVLLLFWTSIVHAYATTKVWIVDGLLVQVDYEGALTPLICLLFVLLALIGISGGNINFLNRSSLHNFYRSRLTRAYLGAANPHRTPTSKVTEVHEKDDVLFNDYKPHAHGGPVHVFNVCVNQTFARKGLYNVDRQGDLMSMVGGEGYCKVPGAGWTRVPAKALATLATWMAVSGAAASPGMGALTKPGYAALLTTLGVRLGYWWNSHSAGGTQSWSDKYLGKYKGLLSELFASFSGKSSKVQYLSDGGHAENTGAYVLIQERCKLIILADCGADPDYKFQDLENLIRRARIDLGVDIRFVLPPQDSHQIFGTLDDLLAREGTACLAVARVNYPGDSTPGVLVLVKPNMVSGLTEDVYNYSRDYPLFPQETTADQFFDEAQWESYFSLGNHLGNLLTAELLLGLEESIGNRDWLESPDLKTKRRPQRVAVKSVAAASIGIGAIITSASGIWMALDKPNENLSPDLLFKSLYTAYGNLSLTATSADDKQAVGQMAAQLLMAWQALRANDEDQLFLRNAETLDMLRKTYALCTDLAQELAACQTLQTVFVCPQKPDESALSMNGGYWARDESADIKLKRANESRTYCEQGVAQSPDEPAEATAVQTPPAPSAAPIEETLELPIAPPVDIAPNDESVGPAAGYSAAPSENNAPASEGTSINTVCAKHTLFIQIYGPDGRDKARAFRAVWRAKGASVPPIEDVVSSAYQQKRSAPRPYDKPTIIYHGEDAYDCAKTLANTPFLPAANWQILPLPPRLTGAVRTIEVWLPPSALDEIVAP